MCVCVCFVCLRLLVDCARDAAAIIVTSSAGAQWRHTTQRAQASPYDAVAVVAAVVAGGVTSGPEARVVVGVARAGTAQARIVVGERIGTGVVATQGGAIAAQGGAIVAQCRAVATQGGAVASQGTGAIVAIASGAI